MDNNFRIVDLIHDITKLDYQVQFCYDFDNMIRVEFRKDYDDSYYEHFHVGHPDGTRNQLEKKVISRLATFLDEAKEHEKK